MESNIMTLKEKLAYLESKSYSGNDLGVTYTKNETTFNVWSPLAEKVVVNLYETGDSKENSLIQSYPLIHENSVWTTSLTGDFENKFYTYTLTIDGKSNETIDIYAKAAGMNGNRAAIIDFNKTNPENWTEDSHVTQQQITDAFIWEVHIEDFSSDENSGISPENQGKYLAFTELGTTYKNEKDFATGVDHLKELGVNYVHLLPVFDFENDEESADYNWGYDPKNYNVPEGRYSSNPRDPSVRIREFKQMVQSLHAQDIGVVLDVVYNHTLETEDSSFNLTVPDYYYRQTDTGEFADGSACGNETASDRNMMRKYMADSILYWATEYHLDGFRFDLMGLHDVETMNVIRTALNENGLQQVILYGEPWDAGSNEIALPNIAANKGNTAHFMDGIAIFNDDFRDPVKGSVFNKTEGGFLQGQSGNGIRDVDVMAGISANTIGAAAAEYELAEKTWARNPTQVVTYNSAHDNLTLYDKLVESTFDKPYFHRNDWVIQINKLAAALLFTSQGVLFMQAGEEFGRTKFGDDNSFVSSIEINQLDWSLKKTNSDLVDYYCGLSTIRRKFSPLRDATAQTAKAITFSRDAIENLIAYTIPNQLAEEGDWNWMAVVLNSSYEPHEVTLESHTGDLPTHWTIIADKDHAGLEALGTVEGNTLTVEPHSALILVS
ncbi:type I pullulanase [Desemzia sp. RIT804]|uniref:type I pullulanase n=1 Tax=Desemzia sp. RIT 804 TaxID=2810209 RepID=UPI0019514EFF|nr:type I pullulanase [Desemzia sp. RIT 804]MBM6615487.1 type I pullulanase [Desemzia sp. RIT 804]